DKSIGTCLSTARVSPVIKRVLLYKRFGIQA
ncbi:MAG: hypothetical protein ACI85J_001751, partial [Candidatus Poriferisodalaceae bacterium]